MRLHMCEPYHYVCVSECASVLALWIKRTMDYIEREAGGRKWSVITVAAALNKVLLKLYP